MPSAVGTALTEAAGVTRHKPRLPVIDQPGRTGLPERIRDAARAFGFERVGFAAVDRFEEGGRRLKQWLEQGYHGQMAYLSGPVDRADPRPAR
jgi:hypothetical protein